MGAQAEVYAKIHAVLTGAGALGTPYSDITTGDPVAHQFTTGTGANQIDKVWSDTRTLAASATENLDLAGVLTDAFGGVLTMAKIRAMLFRAAAANTNSVIVGAAGSNPFTGPLGGTAPTITLPPGGICLLTNPSAGWIVTPTTADILKVTNSAAGSSVTYDVVILGTSA